MKTVVIAMLVLCTSCSINAETAKTEGGILRCPQIVRMQDKPTTAIHAEKLLVDTRPSPEENLTFSYVGVATEYFHAGIFSPELPDDPEADKHEWTFTEGAAYYFVCAMNNGVVYAEIISGFKRCALDHVTMTCE